MRITGKEVKENDNLIALTEPSEGKTQVATADPV